MSTATMARCRGRLAAGGVRAGLAGESVRVMGGPAYLRRSRPGYGARAGRAICPAIPRATGPGVAGASSADSAVSRRLEAVGAFRWRLNAAEVARVASALG